MRVLPEAFQSRRAIRRLNIAAVGLALGCVTGVMLGHIVTDSASLYATTAFAVGFSTFCVGAFWAAFFRPTATPGARGFRIGWWSSVLLAILNAQFAFFLVQIGGGRELSAELISFAIILPATIGVILWLPALVFTFIFFGVPIVHAHALAEKGLAGEERGERHVGVTSLVIAALGLWLSFITSFSVLSPIRIMGYLGMLCGGAAAYAAHVRERRRRAFVQAVEAGNVEGFRVDPSAEGKVLVRVTSLGEGYRVADFREALVDLDESGEAKRALVSSVQS